MKPFAFRGHLDVRCQWQAHELSHESNSGRVERLLRRLLNESPGVDIPLKEKPPGTHQKMAKGVELNVDINQAALIELIEAKQQEWDYKYTATAFKRLMIQACSLPPDRDVSPEEAIVSFEVGETIAVEDWIEVFHSPEAAAHAAGVLSDQHRVKITYGGDRLYLPRGFTGALNPIDRLIRMPDDFVPIVGKRKKLSYVTHGVTLPAFSATDLAQVLFRDSPYRDQLRVVVDQQGGIVLQFDEIPIAILVSEEFFIQNDKSGLVDVAYVPLEGLGAQESIDLFMKAIVIQLKERLSPAFILEVQSLGRIAVVRLDLLDLKAFK